MTSKKCQRHLHWPPISVSVVAFQMGVNSHLSDLSHLGDLWQASIRSMKTLSSWKIKTCKCIEVLAFFACFVFFVSLYFDTLMNRNEIFTNINQNRRKWCVPLPRLHLRSPNQGGS
mmetsp:Transcript_10509/g.20964  ORF Transcript_10509/g.20964 Transcript_10509/m.20964 type:complete len:116 (+) Transcript_10509:227-574(+)